MLIKLDTTNKTIELLEEVSFNELKEFIELLLGGQEYKVTSYKPIPLTPCFNANVDPQASLIIDGVEFDLSDANLLSSEYARFNIRRENGKYKVKLVSDYSFPSYEALNDWKHEPVKTITKKAIE